MHKAQGIKISYGILDSEGSLKQKKHQLGKDPGAKITNVFWKCDQSVVKAAGEFWRPTDGDRFLGHTNADYDTCRNAFDNDTSFLEYANTEWRYVRRKWLNPARKTLYNEPGHCDRVFAYEGNKYEAVSRSFRDQKTFP